jgi:DNA-binding CsgD family transcriptional regulator
MDAVAPVAVEMRRLAERIGGAIAAIGSKAFGERLDELIAAAAPFDLSCVFAYPPEAPPRLVYGGFRGIGSPQALANYLKGTYLLDAVYFACENGIEPGLYRLSDLAPDAFFAGDYYNSWEVHPCISMNSGSLAEEIVFVARLPNEIALAYSVMRSNGCPAFSASEFAQMKDLEPAVRQALLANWRDLGRGEQRRAAPGSMERGFASFAAEALSERERMIVQLILRGHSSLSIADQLTIAEGTVKNHRKHIYAKLGISSQAELFSLFVRHVCG